MKNVQETIETIKKRCALVQKDQCYTVIFSNEQPPSPDELFKAFQKAKQDPELISNPVLIALQDVFNTHSRVYDSSIFFRLLCMMNIFKQAGFIPFCYDAHFITAPFHKYNQGYSLAVACTDTNSKHEPDALLDDINKIYTKYFNDSLTLSKTPSALSCLQDRLDITAKEIAEQIQWLESFQSKMLDDISKESFSHFLCERIHFQIFMGVYSRYPISAPPCTADWRRARIESFFDFPKEWNLIEVETRILMQDPAVKTKKPFPILQGVPEAAKTFMFFHNFVLEQYAVSGKTFLQGSDIVIDAGAYIGDTAIYFAEKNPSSIVYAFEPVPPIAKLAEENCKANGLTNVTIIQEALSDTVQSLSFSASNDWFTDTKLDGNGEYKAQSILLDMFTEREALFTINKSIFIKMDVEGLEMNILRGAQKTITQYKPTCAIALYHKHADYWDIPHFLLDCCPDYTFYFRCDAEPVLFATIKNQNQELL